MAQAKHVGKVVVSLEVDEVSVVPSAERPPVSPDGTYLVTGGAGGLGLSTAEWLVEQGAAPAPTGRAAPPPRRPCKP